jgi:hypothetical protein
MHTHSPNPTAQTRGTRAGASSILRHWLEDLISISLILVVVSALVLAATLHLEHARPERKPSYTANSSASTVPAIYQRRDQGHSIDI